MGLNYYDNENPSSGKEVMVPLRCACPSVNKTANGVKSLQSYMVTWGVMVSSVAKVFGANVGSVLEANMLSQNSIILPLYSYFGSTGEPIQGKLQYKSREFSL